MSRQGENVMASDTRSPDAAVQIRASFSDFLKSIRVPLPLLAAFSVALVGAKTVQVQGFNLPIEIAGLMAMAVLLGIYVQCYKHLAVMKHLCHRQLWPKHQNETRGQQLDQTRFHLKSESSIFNPFSHTDGQLADYLGLFLTQIPLLIIIILTITDLGVAQRTAADMMSVTPLLENPSAYSQEERAEAIESVSAMQRSSIVMMLRYAILIGFYAVFVAFLWRLTQVLSMVNGEDLRKRLIILWGSFALLFGMAIPIVMWIVISKSIAIGKEWMNAWEAVI